MYSDAIQEGIELAKLKFFRRRALIFAGDVTARAFAFFTSFGTFQGDYDSIAFFGHRGLLEATPKRVKKRCHYAKR